MAKAETSKPRNVVGVGGKDVRSKDTSNPVPGGNRNGTQSSQVDGSSNAQLSGTSNNKRGNEPSLR